ncbi:GDP-mannose 4,6-dehydratase, partial [Salinibacterium sp.]|uniref:GDP-mannose 4,6-dehydratase n=1 Tax=Salinibacterium sp. TaxID=1915057 RepID=UPI00286CC7B9
TGVTGQDGTYLASDLLAQGFEVHGLVKPGDVTLADRSPFVVAHEGDLTDAGFLADLIARVAPDEVYITLPARRRSRHPGSTQSELRRPRAVLWRAWRWAAGSCRSAPASR